ncbi:unnamed protein product, partial [Fusarium fujikuroi]
MESHDIYTGTWRNYSTAGLDGKVITLPLQSAGYLISGLTVLLTLAVESCWTITAYALHQCHVSEATDPLELQLQVLLRNVEKPTSAAWHLAKIWRAWRKYNVRHVRKLLYTGLFAIIFAAAIVPVGTIVASIASTREEVVLVLAKPRNCGYVRSNFSVSSSNDAFAASFAYTTDKAIRGRSYAKAWYRNAEASRRDPPSSFPVARLPYRNDTVPCPLKGNRCRYYAVDTNDENMAIALDTGLLDTGAYLGINGPKEHMIQFRKKTTCAPTRIPDLWVPYQDGSDNFTALMAGPYEGPGNITLKFNTRIRDENVGYVTGFAVIDPGATSASLDQWQPTDPFKHDDAILTLHAILPNVVYLGPVNDPMFLASGKSKKVNLGKLTYRSDYFITSLFCLDQVQVCNQNNRKCSSLTHTSEAFRQGQTDLDLNSQQLGVLKRVVFALVDSTTFHAGLSRHAIYGIIRRGRAQESCKDKPRSGRPSALSDQDKSHIKILIKNNPFISYRDIISRARLRASPKTIRRWLIDEKIQHRLALRRPFLTEEAAQLRKSFADKYRHEDESFWYSWWFSDEVTIDRTDGDYTKWSFYRAGERLHKDKVQARRRP